MSDELKTAEVGRILGTIRDDADQTALSEYIIGLEQLAADDHDGVVHIQTYQYDELSNEAKARARESWVADMCEYNGTIDAEIFVEECLTLLTEKYGLVGYDDLALSVFWSLGYVQGDGVAFAGYLCVESLCRHEAEIAELLAWERAEECGYGPCDEDLDVTIEVTNPGHYCHWNSMIVTARASCEGVESALEDIIRGKLADASRECAAAGYAEIEYRRSDEAVAEDLRANEYAYTASGSRSVTL